MTEETLDKLFGDSLTEELKQEAEKEYKLAQKQGLLIKEMERKEKMSFQITARHSGIIVKKEDMEDGEFYHDKTAKEFVKVINLNDTKNFLIYHPDTGCIILTQHLCHTEYELLKQVTIVENHEMKTKCKNCKQWIQIKKEKGICSEEETVNHAHDLYFKCCYEDSYCINWKIKNEKKCTKK